MFNQSSRWSIRLASIALFAVFGCSTNDAGTNDPSAAGEPEPPPNSLTRPSRVLEATLFNSVPGYTVEVRCLGADGAGVERAPITLATAQGAEGKMARGACKLKGEEVGDTGGAFELRVFETATNREILKKAQSINTLTGSPGQTDTDGLWDPRRTHNEHFADGISVAYGFFSAPVVATGDPMDTRDQVYLYLSRSQQTWMTALNTFHNQPLDKWILPGTHDSGMYELRDSSSKTAEALALTQKEDATGQLKAGARYFDFRPGYPILEKAKSKLASFFAAPTVRSDGELDPLLDNAVEASDADRNQVVHMHSIIGGAPYVTFLQQIVDFLVANPGEIVVINAKTSGVPKWLRLDEQADPGLLSWIQPIAEAAQANPKLQVVTDPAKFALTYNELVASGQRLFYFYDRYKDNDRVGGQTVNSYYAYWSKSSTYSDIRTIEGNVDWTLDHCGEKADAVVQLQGTPNALPRVLAHAAVTQLGFGASHLIGSKAWLDFRIYPLLMRELAGCRNSGITILTTDFIDPALTEIIRKALQAQ